MNDDELPYWYPTQVDPIPPAQSLQSQAPPGIAIQPQEQMPPMNIEDYLIGEILKLHDPGPNPGLMRNADRALPYQHAKTIAGTNARNKPIRGEYRVGKPWAHIGRGRPSTKYPGDYYARSYGSDVMFPKEEGED